MQGIERIFIKIFFAILKNYSDNNIRKTSKIAIIISKLTHYILFHKK